MSGITAQSATKSILAADTSADKSASGFVTKEQISFGVTGAPLSVIWYLSKPSNSGGVCKLESERGLSNRFTPDVEGIYTISCLVDGVTSYVLRISAVNVSQSSVISVVHLLPCSDAQVPVPKSGVMLFFSSTSGKTSLKFSDGQVQQVQSL